MNKFCILAAGKGTRNNNIEGLHKALLPLENKPVISHIIDKLGDTEIVIAVGYKSEQIKTYMLMLITTMVLVQVLVIVYCVVKNIYKNHLYSHL